MSLMAKLTQTWREDMDAQRDAIIENVCGLISSRAPIWATEANDQALKETIVNIGLRNVTRSQSKSNSDVIVADIADLIARFEPRLIQVEIDVDEDSYQHNQLKFRLAAVMHSSLGDEAIVLDSFLDFGRNKLDVRKSNLV